MKNTHGDYIKILRKKGTEKTARPQLLYIQRLIGDAFVFDWSWKKPSLEP